MCSSVHVVAWELKVKPGPAGPRYVANFYDPNLTAAHKRVASASLRRFEALQAKDLFSKPGELQRCFGEGAITKVMTVPPGGPTALPPLVRGGDPRRRVTGPVLPVNADVIHQLLLGGFAGTLKDIRPAFAELVQSSPQQARQALVALSGKGTPGLYFALQNGLAHTVGAYGGLVGAASPDPKEHAELLAARSAVGTSGAFMAMQFGHASTVRAFFDLVIASGLPVHLQVELLAAKASIKGGRRRGAMDRPPAFRRCGPVRIVDGK